MATILDVDRDGKPLTMGNSLTNTIVSRDIGAQHLAVNYTRYEPAPDPRESGSPAKPVHGNRGENRGKKDPH